MKQVVVDDKQAMARQIPRVRAAQTDVLPVVLPLKGLAFCNVEELEHELREEKPKRAQKQDKVAGGPQVVLYPAFPVSIFSKARPDL